MGTLSKFLLFTTGAAVGSVVTWHFLKTKYEQLAKEEIESVVEAFSKRYSCPKNDDDQNSEVTEIQEYSDTVKQLSYATVKNEDKPEKEVLDVDDPRVISPEEFGDCDDYDTVSLTYYSDGVLTDELNEPIEDIESMVGLDSLEHFGEYEDDSVFVRNDSLHTDYEILLDLRNYADVIADDPSPAEE